jgi:hypothetical protein
MPCARGESLSVSTSQLMLSSTPSLRRSQGDVGVKGGVSQCHRGGQGDDGKGRVGAGACVAGRGWAVGSIAVFAAGRSSMLHAVQA